MDQTLSPFSCTFSPGIPELLQKLRCSIAISTYQAGKVIFISPKDRDHLIQLPRQFQKPMGIAVHENKLAIATMNEVVTLVNSPELGSTYPKQPHSYDGMYVPRSVYYTGEIDIHDLQYTPQGLLAVNTSFSCLSYITDEFSFTPCWKPSFIENFTPDDCCHLNGVAIENNSPRYVTALGKTSTRKGWRERKGTGGIVADVNTDDIILENLPMPHSPRIYDGELYLLLSATGQIIKVDPINKNYIVIKEFDGFVRGMDKIEEYVFIGLSKLRKTSAAFGDLPIAKKSLYCGVAVLHLPTKSLAGVIRYENSVEEIYDVRILPGLLRPGILNHEKPEFRMALTMPGKTFWAQHNSDAP